MTCTKQVYNLTATWTAVQLADLDIIQVSKTANIVAGPLMFVAKVV